MLSNILRGFPCVPCWRVNFFSDKNTGFLINSGLKIAAAIVSDLGGAAFVAAGGCVYGVTILNIEAVGNGGGGRFEGF